MAISTKEKKLNLIALAVSIVVFLLVGMMRRFKFDVGINLSYLPFLHAILNSLAAVSLIIAYLKIKKKDIVNHKRWMLTAMVLSGLFLLSYVLYHFTQEQTSYANDGLIRYVYFFILITHIILAGAILPFILFTFIRAFLGEYERHKQIARWVYPLWLYVAITGPVVYLFMAPYY